jgi:hypothetical protein
LFGEPCCENSGPGPNIETAHGISDVCGVRLQHGRKALLAASALKLGRIQLIDLRLTKLPLNLNFRKPYLKREEVRPHAEN